MAFCRYYRVEQQPRAREIQSSWRESKSGFLFIPYCTHPSGEFSLTNVRFWPNATSRLACQGNVEKCQLADGAPR